MKKCSKCQRTLEENMFNKCASTKDGLQGWCKDCKSEYMKKRNEQKESNYNNILFKLDLPIEKRVFETKVCKKCGQELPLSFFWKNKKSKDGLQNWCKTCQTEYEKQRKQAIKETDEIEKEEERIIFFNKHLPSIFNWTETIRKYINSEKELNIPLSKLISLNIKDDKLYIKYKK